jgi:methionine aminopeptidase
MRFISSMLVKKMDFMEMERVHLRSAKYRRKQRLMRNKRIAQKDYRRLPAIRYDISNAVQYQKKMVFRLSDLVGHGAGKSCEEPSVLNFGELGTGSLKDGMTLL